MSDGAAPTELPPPEAGLVEPARQRLLVIAADVLGRLPAEEVPASLRPMARFAPARRARLGATVLSAALDAEEGFRDAVADVVGQSSPQLVEAVRTGADTTGSDPLDVAVVAYLVRPEGWRSVLAAANRRWSAERPGEGGAGELTRLRADLAALRERLKAETARSKAARAEAGSAGDSELAEVRRQLRARTGELRGAERERDQARAVADAAHDQLAAAQAAHETEQRRLRTRIGELERAGETARREARTDRELDDARLWLLTETLTSAAAGIRRELSLSPNSRRPADAVAAEGEPGGDRRWTAPRSVADPHGLERLLGLPQLHVIVDGYNVTKTGYGELALADQRTRLVTALAALAGRSGVEVTVAFDGSTRPPAQPAAPRGVRVLFSAPDEIADDLIRRLVAAEPPGRPLLVITSDQAIVTDVTRAGAWTAPSAVLLARLGS